MKTLIKPLILLFFAISISINVFADRELPKFDSLSESSYIALLTCDPGPELYSVFGHSAIGVVDPEQGLMLIYNYGTFSFNVPFFYAKFASGKLLYQLSITSYQRFLREYEYEKRRVVEEKLNLSLEQRQKLFNLLQENYQPENRKYQYDFFFDNCATRIIDIFYTAIGDSLVYVSIENVPPKTFRNLIDEYLTKNYWSDFGIDIALGSVIDNIATEREKAFLPDYLSIYINNCVINGEPFVVSKRKLVPDSAGFYATPWWIRPQFIGWILFIAVTLLTVLYRSKSWIIGDRIVFGVFGLLGVIVLLLWVATEHDATAGNLNVLWANPLYLILVWLIGSRHNNVLKWSASVVLAINVLVLFGWNIIPQMYHVAFIPLIGILILRSGVLAMRYWKET
jgi:hypothetical protein